jgi:hypothetical protein
MAMTRRRSKAVPSTPAAAGIARPLAVAGGRGREVSLLASAALVGLDSLSWDSPRSPEAWQREVWRLLEIVGELRYAAGWVASHMSRVVLRMHDVDEDGEVGGQTDNAQARAVGARVLGSAASRRECLRLAGLNMFLVGEVYLGALSGTGPLGRDEWFAVSSGDIRKEPGGTAYVDLGSGRRQLRPGMDILVRSWTPHPKKVAEADAPTRSVRVVLRELEMLTRFIFAQIESRLASGGVFVVPSGMSTSDGEVTATDLMRKFVEVAGEALKGDGTAAGIVPIVLEVPSDALGKIQHITFSSELSEKALGLREEAIARLAKNLDLPTEAASGMGDTNHWSSYTIGPDAVKTHIEPMAARLCLALQRAWVEPALAAAGLDPERFHLWFDTAPLTVRPQRLKETLDLWNAGLVNAKAVLDAGAYYDSDAPGEEEDIRRFLRELVLRDPQLFNQASVRLLLGITEEMVPTPPPAPAGESQLLTDSKTPPPPPPAPKKVPSDTVAGREPVSRERPPRGVTASSAVTDPRPLALFVLADAVTLRALELAGGRLLDHRTRGLHKDVPRHELHTVIPMPSKPGCGPREQAARLLTGSMEMLPLLAATIGMEDGTIDVFSAALQQHCVSTLLSGEPHSRERMVSALQVAGVVDGTL